MAKTALNVDAWRRGDAIPGSVDIPQDDGLGELMYDGALPAFPWACRPAGC